MPVSRISMWSNSDLFSVHGNINLQLWILHAKGFGKECSDLGMFMCLDSFCFLFPRLKDLLLFPSDSIVSMSYSNQSWNLCFRREINNGAFDNYVFASSCGGFPFVYLFL